MARSAAQLRNRYKMWRGIKCRGMEDAQQVARELADESGKPVEVYATKSNWYAAHMVDMPSPPTRVIWLCTVGTLKSPQDFGFTL